MIHCTAKHFLPRTILIAILATLLDAGSAYCAAGDLQGTAVSASQLSQLLMRATYPVTNGYQPIRVHAGIDFGGTGDGVISVYAPLSGTITANTSACGKVAIYDGRNTFILAHMTARTSLSVGTSISAGTYVGKASKVVGGGCTATAAHLHVEIRVGNNSSMAAPASDNSSTTLNPLTYQYDTSPPTISITSPARGASLSTGQTYTLSWSASDPSGIGDLAVDLISSNSTTCYGATSVQSIRLAGAGYVNSLQWRVPTSLARIAYNLKVAVRDNLNNWGCVMIPVSIR